MLNKDDIVTIHDNSWTRSVVDGKLIHELLTRRAEKDKKYVVVETDCSFPLEGGHYSQPDKYRNDTVIQAVDSGKVVFIRERSLRLVEPTHKIIIDIVPCGIGIYNCGEFINISDKLYKEIKRGNSQTQ